MVLRPLLFLFEICNLFKNSVLLVFPAIKCCPFAGMLTFSEVGIMLFLLDYTSTFNFNLQFEISLIKMYEESWNHSL